MWLPWDLGWGTIGSIFLLGQTRRCSEQLGALAWGSAQDLDCTPQEMLCSESQPSPCSCAWVCPQPSLQAGINLVTFFPMEKDF